MRLTLRPHHRLYAVTSVEGGIYAHMQTCLGVTLGVPNPLKAIKAVSLKSQHPLIVAHTESTQSRALNIWILSKTITAVISHNA